VYSLREVSCDFPNGRPTPEDRTYTSTAIDSLIANLSPLLSDPDLAVLLSNCLPNTLDTTVEYHGEAPDWAGLDSFVITGDIQALWLRDSANQIIPYAPYIAQDDSLKALFQGLINRQAHSILIDSFANAFNFNASGAGAQTDIRKPPMTKAVFEGKYEIDSLCAFLKLSYWFNFYGELSSGDYSAVYDGTWYNAVTTLLDTINVMMTTNGLSEEQPYLFSRMTTVATDTLYNNGKGPPAKIIGMSRQLFRPSDDAVTLPFNIPGNAMACTELTHLVDLLSTIGGHHELKSYAADTKETLCAALSAELAKGQLIPFEVDGYGSRYFMDDANIPSLLSLPVLGYMGASNPSYVATRDFVLSTENPYYFTGPEGHGIGGPHEGYNMTWPMAIITTAMTSDDDEEILDCLQMLKDSARRTGFMHEAFNVNNVNDYTRSWFAWANGLFGEMMLQLVLTKPHLVIGSDPETVALAQSYVKPPVCLEAQRNVLVK
jgi:uncharacterized protein